MCELLAVTVPESAPPLQMDTILLWSRQMDEWGLAGYGWGMVWVQDDDLHRYRSVAGIRNDPVASQVLPRIVTRRLFVHVRRPSLMTNMSHVDAQPYLDQDAGLAFAHNGYLAGHQELRPRYQAHLTGRSDSEVGFQLWLEGMRDGSSPEAALIAVHDKLGGQANFMTMARDGQILAYAGNVENAVYRFRIGDWSIAATSLHSFDRFVFETIFPDAVDIEPVAAKSVVAMP
ncbi:MAG: class II glutamine amidotransferase [Clostridia bacterium]